LGVTAGYLAYALTHHATHHWTLAQPEDETPQALAAQAEQHQADALRHADRSGHMTPSLSTRNGMEPYPASCSLHCQAKSRVLSGNRRAK